MRKYFLSFIFLLAATWLETTQEAKVFFLPLSLFIHLLDGHECTMWRIARSCVDDLFRVWESFVKFASTKPTSSSANLTRIIESLHLRCSCPNICCCYPIDEMLKKHIIHLNSSGAFQQRALGARENNFHDVVNYIFDMYVQRADGYITDH